MRILVISKGGNPALDMAYCGLRELGYEVLEYPMMEYRHNDGLALSASGYPPHEITDYETILKMCNENGFDLLISDRFDKNTDDKIVAIIDACNCRFAVVDQTGVNNPCNIDFWNERPYYGKIPNMRYVRTKPDTDTVEQQETLLMSTRRNWIGPTYDDHETKYLSVFLGILYMGFHDAHYRRLLVHDVYEDYPATFFSRTQKFYGEEYYKLLSESLTAVNIKGMVWDCWRFWEILQAGSCLLTEDTTNVINYNPPFIDGEHYFTFKFQFDYDSHLPKHISQELIDLLGFVQGNVGEIERIARRGREFALECHNTTNRAKQILEVLE